MVGGGAVVEVDVWMAGGITGVGGGGIDEEDEEVDDDGKGCVGAKFAGKVVVTAGFNTGGGATGGEEVVVVEIVTGGAGAGAAGAATKPHSPMISLISALHCQHNRLSFIQPKLGDYLDSDKS